MATPVSFHLYFTDPSAVCEIFSRRQDFVRPIIEYKILEIFGPSLTTAGWDDWSRHRKPLAAPFNESVMKFVWSETLRQSQAMAASWSGHAARQNGIVSTAKDVRTFSLNVLAAIGFGKSYDFDGSSDGPVAGKLSNYRDALATVLDNSIVLMLVPLPWLKSSWAPRAWVKIGAAADSFMEYMKRMVADEQAALEKGKSGTGAGVMTSFVHALHEHEAYEKSKDPSLPDIPKYRRGLSLDEVYSNLFIINFAGHDTTANTITFALFCLAAYPDVQEWVAEEIAAVVGGTPIEDWDYKTLFPKLNRCRSILYESLRLFPPIMVLPKWTAAKSQHITVAGKSISIPPGISTNVYIRGIHTLPEYWDDPLAWKPRRWIVDSKHSILGDEKFFEPSAGTYFPWSSGPQNCPGKKFAEAEAVALIAYLLNGRRITVKRRHGESKEAACRRAYVCTQKVNADLLLRMEDSGDTKLEYYKVGEEEG
ncbi:cytochrome P450, partial [Metarhizium majus ARSEF 297]